MSENPIPAALTDLSATPQLNPPQNINDIPRRISRGSLEISATRYESGFSNMFYYV